MVKLFPELTCSLSISFQPACSKSKRRFPDAQKIPCNPITADLWDAISLDGLIKKHSKETTNLCRSQVPDIMARIDILDKRKQNKPTTWPLPLTEKERQKIKEFLHKPAEVAQVLQNPPEATRLEKNRACPMVVDKMQFPDIGWNSSSDEKQLSCAQFPDITLKITSDTDPFKNRQYDETVLQESREDDPAGNAQFPDCLEGAPENAFG